MYVPRLNRRVTILTRTEVESTSDMGITRLLQNSKPVYAAVVGVDSIEFTNSVNNGYEYTHKIYVRYLDYLSINHVIVHQSKLPDGSTRTDLYKILRYSIVDGIYFYTELECVLEKPTWASGTSFVDTTTFDAGDTSFNDGTSFTADPVLLDYGTTVFDEVSASDE